MKTFGYIVLTFALIILSVVSATVYGDRPVGPQREAVGAAGGGAAAAGLGAGAGGSRAVAEVKVLSSTGRRSVGWKADEAVKFSLDQLVTAVQYLFAAAAAGMAFIGKIVIEPRVGQTGATGLGGVATVFRFAAVFWLGSLVCGMLAHLSLAELGAAETFTIYGEFGWYMFFQLAYFGIGMVLFLAALVQI